MLSNFTRMLSSGARELIRPKNFLHAIYGCLRIVVEKIINNTASLDAGYVPAGRCGMFTVSVPITSVTNSANVAGVDGILAGSASDASYAGAVNEDEWFISGLPKKIVLLGKSADDRNCLLAGSDFQETTDGYIFSKNPLNYGTIRTTGSAAYVSFLCLGGEYQPIFPPELSISYSGVSNICTKTMVDSIRAAANSSGVTQGKVNAQVSGRNFSPTDSTLLATWEEGGTKIGRTEDMLLFANPRDAIRDVGSTIPAGHSLTDKSETEVTPVAGATDVSGICTTLSNLTLPINGVGTTISYVETGSITLAKSEKGTHEWVIFSKDGEPSCSSLFHFGMSCATLNYRIINSNMRCCIIDRGANKPLAIVGGPPECGDRAVAIAHASTDDRVVCGVTFIQSKNTVSTNSLFLL